MVFSDDLGGLDAAGSYWVMPISAADRGLLILTSLAEGPKHGYALMQDIALFAGVTLGPGTLYGALTRLEAQGLIASLPAERRRRPYAITKAGGAALQRELSENAKIARLGLRRLAENAELRDT